MRYASLIADGSSFPSASVTSSAALRLVLGQSIGIDGLVRIHTRLKVLIRNLQILSKILQEPGILSNLRDCYPVDRVDLQHLLNQPHRTRRQVVGAGMYSSSNGNLPTSSTTGIKLSTDDLGRGIVRTAAACLQEITVSAGSLASDHGGQSCVYGNTRRRTQSAGRTFSLYPQPSCRAARYNRKAPRLRIRQLQVLDLAFDAAGHIASDEFPP
ncbi:hypothetical protein KC362_g62 [Hortaea werneckii]|nr:hypothetical protein KC362_g62 [Hortaea werneckii]